MAKIGRNDPCPCGSGQKYKRCCLPREETIAVERARTREREEAVAVRADEDDLDEASNRVIDLIHAGRLDEAEHAAQDLLEDYPEVHDGLERVAMVAAARGDRARAAEYYRKAADFVHARPAWYDPEMEVYLRARATQFSAPE